MNKILLLLLVIASQGFAVEQSFVSNVFNNQDIGCDTLYNDMSCLLAQDILVDHGIMSFLIKRIGITYKTLPGGTHIV